MAHLLPALADWHTMACNSFHSSNFNLIAKLIIQGSGGVEDFELQCKLSLFSRCYWTRLMLRIVKSDQKYPTMGPYWEQKRPDMKKINIPTYLSGSDVSSLHTMGTLRAWLEIPTSQKWLRWCVYPICILPRNLS